MEERKEKSEEKFSAFFIESSEKKSEVERKKEENEFFDENEEDSKLPFTFSIDPELPPSSAPTLPPLPPVSEFFTRHSLKKSTVEKQASHEQKPPPFQPTPTSGISHLLLGTAPKPLLHLLTSLLYDVRDNFIAPILAFNLAVWKYRKPAQASRLEESRVWMINRIVETAVIVFSSIKPKGRKTKKPIDSVMERKVHDKLVDQMDLHTAICYSDGSASPNPGPCGSGVSIFLRCPDMVFDYGASLGRGTNNLAELYGLGIIFSELMALQESNTKLQHAVVFCDSKLALRSATSRKKPLTNCAITSALRVVFQKVSKKISVNLQWIRGHVDYGGNERVDRISKLFASTTLNNRFFVFDGIFHSQCRHSDWPPSYPLTSLPTEIFIKNLIQPDCSFLHGVHTGGGSSFIKNSHTVTNGSSLVDLAVQECAPIATKKVRNLYNSPILDNSKLDGPSPVHVTLNSRESFPPCSSGPPSCLHSRAHVTGSRRSARIAQKIVVTTILDPADERPLAYHTNLMSLTSISSRKRVRTVNTQQEPDLPLPFILHVAQSMANGSFEPLFDKFFIQENNFDFKPSGIVSNVSLDSTKHWTDDDRKHDSPVADYHMVGNDGTMPLSIGPVEFLSVTSDHNCKVTPPECVHAPKGYNNGTNESNEGSCSPTSHN